MVFSVLSTRRQSGSRTQRRDYVREVFASGVCQRRALFPPRSQAGITLMRVKYTQKSRWPTWCLLCCLLLLGACSGTTFVYNRLDFFLPWYVDDYAELNTQQDAYLKEIIAPFLAWHRNQELPAYIEIIDDIESRLAQPVTAAVVSDIFGEFEQAWLRIEGEALGWLLDLGAQLSDEQVAGFLEVMWEQQEEYAEEYLERTDEEFYEDSYDNLVDNANDFLGSVSTEQREQLRKASLRLLRSDQPWLQERAEWLDQLAVLLERQPGWQQRVREAVVARRENLSPAYLSVFENNMGVIFDAIARLLNERSEQQDRHLRNKLSGLREDMQVLVVEGRETSGP